MIPFEEVLAPFVFVAMETLCAGLSKRQMGFIGPHALGHRAEDLLASVSRVCERALLLEFTAFRAQKRSSLHRSLIDTGSRDYRAFVEMLLRDGLLSFFENYAAAARLLGTRIRNWIESTREVVATAEADRVRLGATLFGETSVQRISSVREVGSDPHDWGRTVLVTTFDGRHRVVYKPRTLSLEIAFGSLLRWINHAGWPIPFRVPVCLDGDGYGWMEYVAPTGCATLEEVRNYYFRAGGLLCLLRVLGGTDAHADNVIAAGDQPVLVDLETLLQAPMKAAGTSLSRRPEDFTVLDTYFLPRWETSDDGHAWDESGLGAEPGLPTGRAVPRILSPNTDRMRYETSPSYVASVPSAVKFNGALQQPAEHADSLMAGFREMHRVIRNARFALSSNAGPLKDFENLDSRCIFRPTGGYLRLLDRAVDPACLRTGADRDAELSAISAPFTDSPATTPPRLWSLVRAERAALFRGDIPRFSSNTGSRAIRWKPEGSIDEALEWPGYEGVLSRLDAMTEDDCERQLKLVRAAIAARYEVNLQRTHAETSRKSRTKDGTEAEDVLLARACEIADCLQGSGLVPTGGDGPWLGLTSDPRTGRLLVGELGVSLYDGVGGIAVFFAALAACTRQRHYAATAIAGARHLVGAISNEEFPLRRRCGVGGVDGMGSLLYALTLISVLLKDRSLVRLSSARLLDQIEEGVEMDDVAFDVLSGLAGALLALLVFYEVFDEGRALRIAIRCGDRLTERQVPAHPTGAGWPALDSGPLTGMAHGAAGISLALLRLWHLRKASRYREAAEAALAFERSHTRGPASQWPDLRGRDPQPSSSSGSMNAWCHGPTGIGLARLGSNGWDSEASKREVDAAVRAVVPNDTPANDSLCCGRAGRAELLLLAAEESTNVSVPSAASLLLGVVHRGETLGYELDGPSGVADVQPTLFRGLSGIGYQCLRTARPGSVPSLLVFEAPNRGDG